jgi:glyoxylase-like metal-dependent hydrolase (beta-lactamase superfamily II)
VSDPLVGEILDGLWRFEALHPEWTEDEAGEDGWEQTVAWWALATENGLALIDPLVADWVALDGLVEAHGGCAGIVRTCQWHQRSIDAAVSRYGAEVWARPPAGDAAGPLVDHPVGGGEELFGGAVRIVNIERGDEIGLWLPAHTALVFGDAMLRRAGGVLRVCPDSWLQPVGGPERLRTVLRELASLPVEHVLVSHGPESLGGGRDELLAATA